VLKDRAINGELEALLNIVANNIMHYTDGLRKYAKDRDDPILNDLSARFVQLFVANLGNSVIDKPEQLQSAFRLARESVEKDPKFAELIQTNPAVL